MYDWGRIREAEMLNDLPLQLMKVLNEIALISRLWYKLVHAQPQGKRQCWDGSCRTQYSSINVAQGACLEKPISVCCLRG